MRWLKTQELQNIGQTETTTAYPMNPTSGVWEGRVYVVEVERLFQIDPRLKCSNFRIKEEEDSDKNITTNRRSSAKPTEKNMNSH